MVMGLRTNPTAVLATAPVNRFPAVDNFESVEPEEELLFRRDVSFVEIGIDKIGTWEVETIERNSDTE